MNKHKLKNKKHTGGFSLLETVIYFSMLAVISVVVITNIISLFKNYNIVRANQDIEYNAISILDKMSRNIHDAKSIIVEQSSFLLPEGAVALNISSSTDDTSSTTVKFYLEAGKLKYMQDGTYLGNLSTNAVTVTNFKLYHITAISSDAVKVEMTLQTNPHLSSVTISKNFYTTIQLRE